MTWQSLKTICHLKKMDSQPWAVSIKFDQLFMDVGTLAFEQVILFPMTICLTEC